MHTCMKMLKCIHASHEARTFCRIEIVLWSDYDSVNNERLFDERKKKQCVRSKLCISEDPITEVIIVLDFQIN